MPRKVGILAWLNVVLVGALVLGLVFVMHLYPRLNSGQKVVDGLKPAFAPARVVGDRTGINFASSLVNVADPLTTANGTGASEVPKLVALVSAKTGLPPAAVLATIAAQFPHTLALLEAIPLSAVTAELPQFLTFVADTLKVTPTQLATTLQTGFPHLYQALANLPVVTNGWDDIPGLNGLTRFDGTTVVKSAPQLRDYLSSDVIPVVEKHRSDFHRLATYFPPVKGIPLLLVVIGGIAVLYGLLMMLRAASTAKVKRKEGFATWTVVLLLGLIVLGLIFGTGVYPRLDGGSHLLRDAKPVFVPARVTADVTGVKFVGNVIAMADPIMNDQGGAAADIANLEGMLVKATGLAAPKLLAAVGAKFPHTAALLQALPLSSVNAEIPGVLELLHVVLNASPADVLTALKANVPGLAQSITNLPAVVNGWDNFPGGAGLTRFDGSAVKTAPQLQAYFSTDVVATVSKVAPDFRKLNSVSPDLTLFPGLLTTIGAVVVLYGLIMLLVTNMPDPEEKMALHRAGHRRAVRATSQA